MRLLVTGSRDWPDANIVENVLTTVTLSCGHESPFAPITLVHGDCPSGADLFADLTGEARGWDIERHPAQWETYGKAAGPRRNQEMVDLGADVCVAFIHDGSRGATHCLTQARYAGIRTVVVRIDGLHVGPAA